MHAELADLTARWLAAGHPPTTVRRHILRGLPDDGSPVHRPGGLLRYLLRDVPPLEPRTPDGTRPPAPDHERPASPRLSARLASLRECEGEHVQATLFRPFGDERLCPGCADARPSRTPAPSAT